MVHCASASLLVALLLLVASGEALKSPREIVDTVEAAKSSEEAEEADRSEGWVVPKGLTAGNLDKFAEDLEDREILIYYEVKKQAESGKKHVLLYYYDVSGQGDSHLKTYHLGELFPLDISVFIEHGWANEDDELDVEFRDQEVIARIRHPSTPQDAGDDKGPKEYTMPIRQAGGIGYVRLSEIEQLKSEQAEEKLYYVRVPFNLFTKLDGETLQKHAGAPFLYYKKYNCKSPVAPVSASASSMFFCLVLTFGTGDEDCTQTELATQLYISETPLFHYITAKEVGHFNSSINSWKRRPFVGDPELASASNLQYVVLAGLAEFNRMELKFVEEHGRLVEHQEPRIRKGKLELKFKKNGKTTVIPFLFMSCWVSRCLNSDMIVSTTHNHSEAEPEAEGMGVTYSYGGNWEMP